MCWQSSSGNQHHQKSKSKKSKSPKRSARSDGEGSPAPTKTKKSKKKKVASADRTLGTDSGVKSKDVEASEADEKSSVTEQSSSLTSPRATVRSSVLAATTSKTMFGPRTPPGPEPTSVSSLSWTVSNRSVDLFIHQNAPSNIE